MSSWMAVARREMQGRLSVCGAALVLGLVPLALPHLLGYAHGSELRLAATSALALLFGALFAIVVGGGMIGGELADRRLAFYFARPLSAAAIFGGKAAALLLLLVGAQLLIWLPTMLVDPMRDDLWPALAIVIASTPLLVGVGLAGGITARCRSPWLLLDVVVAVATLGVFALLVRDLTMTVWLHPSSPLHMFAAVGAPLGLLAAALLAGAAAALARGRTDGGRAHRAMSVVLALTLLPAGGTALAVTRALERVDIRRLAGVTAAVAAPAGDWIYVSGPVDKGAQRGYEPDFFVQPTTGRSRQLGFIVGGPFPSFSPDGTRAAWIETGNALDVLKNRARAENVLVVGSPGSASSERRATVDGDFMVIDWSADGSRLALFDAERIEVHDAATLRLLSQASAPHGAQFVRAQLTADGMRAFARDERGVTVLALAHERATTVSRLETPVRWLDVAPTGDQLLVGRPDGSIDLVRLEGGGARRLMDASPARPANVSPALVYESAGGFLPDGRIALVCMNGDAAAICLYDGGGRIVRTVELANGRLRMGPLTPRGLLVGLDPRPTPTQKYERLWFVDLDAGSRRPLDDRWRLVWTSPRLVGFPMAQRLLVRDIAGGLIAWDPQSDRVTTVIPNR
jgi:hypothetical protein